ncbi:MAG TPA: OmpA family protein [Edaphocola sp.]|nr:OmpA family protein [Edaphocola sp.]
MRYCIFFMVVVMCLPYFPVRAQQPVFGDKAQKWYEEAVLYELHHQPEKALAFYKKSIRKDPRNLQVYWSLAHLLSHQQDFYSAAKVLKQARAYSGKDAQSVNIALAEALFRAGEYDDAGFSLDNVSGSAPLSKNQQAQIRLLRASIQWAKQHMALPYGDTPINPGPRINSAYNEYFPSVSLDDSTLVFTRETNGIDQDFYLARRDSCGGWFAANPLGEPPNSPQQEGAQMLSADGHYLFFMRCQNESPNGWALGGCDLYFSYTTAEGWSQPVPFGGTINTPAFEGMPSLSPDNKTLYFVSDRAGGYGGKDIWMSRFQDGLWQVPENLGPEINTPGDETAPWIAVDNQTLYFTSNGHPGFGGNDIFLSRKRPEGQWSAAVNLGYPINTSSDDASMTVSNDGQKAYFSSNRPGGSGGMDIYETSLPEALQPYPRTWLYGIVRDSLDKSRLTLAILTWTNLETGRQIAQYQSNWGNASYLSAFPLNTPLALNVTRYNYLDINDTFCFTRQYSYPPDTMDLDLLPQYYSPPLTDTNLLTVYFDKNTFTINDSVAQWIRQRVLLFKDGRYNEFIVNGFTDTSGNPALNAEISFERARALKAVLSDMGIPEDKIEVEGWADSSPSASNNTEEGRALNRRAVLVLRRPKR